MAWWLAKVLDVILCIAAVPALVIGLVSAAGAFLLIPVGLIAGAWGLLNVQMTLSERTDDMVVRFMGLVLF